MNCGDRAVKSNNFLAWAGPRAHGWDGVSPLPAHLGADGDVCRGEECWVGVLASLRPGIV